MSRPYLVTTHRQLCRSCQREVEDEELVVNSDGFRVHVECGTVLEMEGFEVHDQGLSGELKRHARPHCNDLLYREILPSSRSFRMDLRLFS